MVEIVEPGGYPGFRGGGACQARHGCFLSLGDLEHDCFEVFEAPFLESFGLFGFFTGDFTALGKGAVFDEIEFRDECFVEFSDRGVRSELDVAVLQLSAGLRRGEGGTSLGPEFCVHRATMAFFSGSTSMISVDAGVICSSSFSCTLFL